MSPRFSIYSWGRLIGRRGTLDEVHAEIARFHRERELACKFWIDASVTHLSPGQEIPHAQGYCVVDHHDVDDAVVVPNDDGVVTDDASASPDAAPASLEDACKAAEAVEAARRATPGRPILARLDGRSFHQFTRGLTRPFDPGLSALLIDVATYLVEETHAVVGYAQSDEITLAWDFAADASTEILFGGRFQKLASVLAGMASARFCLRLPAHMPAEVGRLARTPHFDCRIWQVANRTAAADVFRWREADATKNSVTMAALAEFSHADILNKSSREKRAMLASRGVIWSEFPRHFRCGTYLRRRAREVPLDEATRAKIPIAHRPPPGALVTRSGVVDVDLPPARLIGNFADVLFSDAVPEVALVGLARAYDGASHLKE